MKIGLEKTNNKSLRACYMKADVIDLPFIDESVDIIVNARSGTVKTFPIAFNTSLNTIEKCCNVAVLLIDAVKADDKIIARIKLGVVIFP